jgi:hypothetical protein
MAIESHDRLAARLDKVANLAFWEIVAQVEAHPVPTGAGHAPAEKEAILMWAVDRVPSLYCKGDPELAFLFKEALNRRKLLPRDEASRLTGAVARAGHSPGWRCCLPRKRCTSA